MTHTAITWQRKLCVFVLVALSVLGVTSRPRATAAQDKPVVLARMKGATITSDDLADKAYERQFLSNKPFKDYQICKNLLDELIVDVLVGLEAAKYDVSKDYSFRERLRLDEASAALVTFQNTSLFPGLVIDSATIDSFYQANIARYTTPQAQRKVRQITVYKKGSQIPKSYVTYVDPVYEGWDPKRKVDSIYTRLANGEDFSVLANAHSEELKAKLTKGELGWLSRVSVVDSELVDPIFNQPLHMISKPYETSYGWVVAQVTDERGAGPAPIDEQIRNDIVYQLKLIKGRDAALALTDSLVAAGTVEYNDSLLDGPDEMIGPEDVFAIVNRRDTLWGAGYLYRKRQTGKFRMQPTLTRAEKDELVQPMVRNLFLYGAMRAWGYLDDPELATMLRRQQMQYAKEQIWTQFAGTSDAPDSADIAKYYRDHIAEFTPERRHQVEMVRFGDRDSARQVMDAWRSGTHPAGTHTKMVGPDDLPAPVWNKLAAVTPGSLVGPIGSKGEYWLLHLVRILAPKPLSEVSSVIASNMRKKRLEQKKQSWVETMSRRYRVERYDERLRSIELPSRADPRFARDTAAAAL